MQLSTALNLPNRQVSVGGFGYGASLALDFTSGNQTLDPRITFTRSTTATRTNSSGLIESVAINAPRFDYDPVTLAPKGLLIEEQRTNLLTYSEQFDNAAWNKGRTTVTANTIVSPDGTLDGDKLVEDTTASNTHTIVQSSISFTSGLSYALSVYAKAAERSVLRLTLPSAPFGTAVAYNFDLINGTATLVTTGTSNSSTITSVGNGWYRCTVTAQATATASSSITLSLISGGASSYTGDGFSGLFLWGAQLEAGAFATSYIPTVASQVTRAVDNALMTGTNFSSWYNASEGTFYAQFTPAASNFGAIRNMFLASDNTTANFVGLRYVSAGASPGLGANTGGVSQASISTGGMIAGTTYQVAGAYKLNDFAVSRNGAAVVVDTSATIPTVTQAEIGTLAGLNVGTQYIRRLAYYNRRLTNAELQGITA